MDVDELNELNKRIYAQRGIALERQLADPLIRKKLTEELASEDAHGVPVRARRTIEEICEAYDRHGTAILSRQAAKGGAADKGDDLTTFIRQAVAERPTISEAELLKLLKASTSLEWLQEITKSKIFLRDKTEGINISNLKDRLTRAKKKNLAGAPAQSG